MIRTLGYVLIGTSLVLALILLIIGRENVWLLLFWGACLLTGAIFMASTAARMLYRGDVKLRPNIAIRKFPKMFLVMFAWLFFVRLVFPTTNFGVLDMALICILLAAFLALHTTAYYRKIGS